MTVRNTPPPSLSAIRDRCTIEDHHWIWKLGTNRAGNPSVNHGGRMVMVRRLVLHARDGRALASSLRAICTCDHPLCVSPECTAAASPGNALKLAAQRGAFSRSALRHLRTAITRRARSRVSDEQIRRIRASTEPGVALASQLGLTPQYISDVRNGRIRRDLGTPWAGAGARA